MKSYRKALLLMLFVSIVQSNAAFAEDLLLKRGRYLVEVTGCNDCHTPGYAQQEAKVPVENWLVGNPVGFQGPWGITFPINLRLLMQKLTEDEWVKKAKTFKARPPMPWFNVRFMTEEDQRAIYRFVKSLGPAGDPAPEFVPPGVMTKNMFIPFMPVTMEKK